MTKLNLLYPLLLCAIGPLSAMGNRLEIHITVDGNESNTGSAEAPLHTISQVNETTTTIRVNFGKTDPNTELAPMPMNGLLL